MPLQQLQQQQQPMPASAVIAHILLSLRDVIAHILAIIDGKNLWQAVLRRAPGLS